MSNVSASDISRVMAHLGRQGGKQTSAAKQEAARTNGRKGGRPKKPK